MSNFSTVAWQLALSLPNVKQESGGSGTGETISNNGDLCVLIFRSLISPDKPVIIGFSFAFETLHIDTFYAFYFHFYLN